MARKRKQGEMSATERALTLIFLAIWGLVIALVAAICTAAVYIVPIALTLGVIIFEIRIVRTPKDFAYSSEEISNLSKIQEKLRHATARLAQIEEDGIHLWRNLDDSYDRRSRHGRQLNVEREKLIQYRDVLEDRFNEAAKRPIEAIDTWKRVVNMRDAFRWAAPTYTLSALALYQLSPDWMADWSHFVESHVLLHLSGAPTAAYGSTFIGGLLGAAFFLITYSGRLISLNHSTEEMKDALRDIGREQRDRASFSSSYFEDDRSDADSQTSDEDEDEDEDEVPPPWYEILGVLPTASAQEINSAWRSRVIKCHPDKVSQLDPEFKALADQKIKALNAARDEGLKSR